MVFCKECQQKVEDCPHFVAPPSTKGWHANRAVVLVKINPHRVEIVKVSAERMPRSLRACRSVEALPTREYFLVRTPARRIRLSRRAARGTTRRLIPSGIPGMIRSALQ